MTSIENKGIRDILDKYFEALTTLEEEQRLRDYFNGEVAAEFAIYKPLFNALSEERKSIISAIEKSGLIDNGSDLIYNDSPTNHRVFRFKWFAGVAAAAVIVFMLTLLSQKRDSLQLMVDGISVNNNELAISMAESQLSRVNHMLCKYKQSNEQLEGLNRVGNAISPLASMEKLLKQSP